MLITPVHNISIMEIKLDPDSETKSVLLTMDIKQRATKLISATPFSSGNRGIVEDVNIGELQLMMQLSENIEEQ